MAKTVTKKKPLHKKVHVSPFNIYMNKTNYIILGVGAILILIGFLVMSTGLWNSTPALVYSPIILLIAYLIIIPLAIFYKKKNHSLDKQEQHIAAGKS